MKRFLLAAAALMALAGPAEAQMDRRIGVVVNVRVNIDAERARELATALGEALEEKLPVEVVAGTETERRLPPEGLPDECVADAGCRNTLGRRLDADELLMLVVVEMGDSIQVDATWADVASGRVTSRPRITIEDPSKAQAVFEEQADELLPHIARRAKEGDRKKDPTIVVVKGDDDDDAPRVRGRHMTVASWTAAGIGAAALIGGSVFALSAMQKHGSLQDDDCDRTPCPPGDVDALENHALAADILFVTAAASATVSLVLYLRSGGELEQPKPASPPPVSITTTGDSVGVSFGGRF